MACCDTTFAYRFLPLARSIFPGTTVEFTVNSSFEVFIAVDTYFTDICTVVGFASRISSFASTSANLDINFGP